MTRFILIVGTVALLAGAAMAAQEPARRLRAAINAELVEGNVQTAMAEYEALAAGADRATAATALVRLGDLHRKLGATAQSQAAFQTVVRDYGDQPEAFAAAQARLDAQAPAAPAGTGLDAIQLWHGTDIEGDASLSPDGRYLVYSSWRENTNLVVKDLETGVSRTITNDAAIRTNGTQPWGPVFSPDGARIAYAFYGERERSLRIINRDGSDMRVIATGSVDFPWAWSPDGRSIALLLYDTGQSRIAIASVDDGSIAPLLSTGWQKARVGGFSADGRLLVYAIDPSDDEPGGLYTLAVDGGAKTRLGEGRAATWTPDGRAVVFVSGRSGSDALWMLPVVDGRPGGNPVQLRPNTSADFIRFTNDGRLFYGFRNLGNDIFATRLDPGTGRAEEPALLVDVFVGSNGGPAWSPDGQRLAFTRRQGGIDGAALTLVVRDVVSGRERVVERSLDDGLLARVRWYPDGRAVFVRDGRGFKAIDLETGTQRMLFTAPRAAAEVGLQWDLSPDGRFLYYVQLRRAEPDAPPVFAGLIKRDLETGVEASLVTAPGAAGAIVVSPDGRQLAVSSRFGLTLIPADGGETTKLQPRVRGGAPPFRPLAFSADGRHILASRPDGPEVGATQRLWSVPVAGGDPVRTDMTGNISGVSVAPDGRLAIGWARPSEELWLVRNLLDGGARP